MLGFTLALKIGATSNVWEIIAEMCGHGMRMT